MLVLTRKEGQRITIGDAIEITVLGVQGNNVRLGIRAPREIPIRRDELLGRVIDPPQADQLLIATVLS
jgi:carbon storage regulator